MKGYKYIQQQITMDSQTLHTQHCGSSVEVSFDSNDQTLDFVNGLNYDEGIALYLASSDFVTVRDILNELIQVLGLEGGN